VGLGKTGTTFLQERVFHKFTGIHYIDTHKYYKIDKKIEQVQDSRNILVSREFDRQLRREVLKFAEKHSNVTPIIVFRKHSSYIASQYRRFVKNGFNRPFEEFFNFDDSGFFKVEHLTYCDQIEFLEQTFGVEPIVYVYNDLMENSESYIEQFAHNVGASVELDTIDFSKKHTSYNEKQLKIMYAVGQRINMQRKAHPIRWINILSLFARYIPKYSILYLSNLVPNSWVSSHPLIDTASLEEVDQFFAKDWEIVLSKAKRTDTKTL
jgi:hypothetical protein